jgi:hypothetical protein
VTKRDLLVIAQGYRTQGYVPIPVVYRKKKPSLSDWTEFDPTDESLQQAFGNGPMNIGLLMGKRSGNLVDIDLDDPISRQLAPHFLPETGWMQGREGAPGSHYFYIAPGLKTEKFASPNGGDVLVEIRSTGCQTVVAPSIHPSGEAIATEAAGAPGHVAAEHLRASVAQLATATLLVHHYPKEGSRHDLANALSGWLIRGGWSEEQVAHLIGVVADAAGDEEREGRLRNVRTTAKRLMDGEPATGAPSVAEILGNEVTHRLEKWLGLSGVAAALPVPAPEEVEATAHTEEAHIPLNWTFTGDRLRAVRNRLDPPSPLPGVLDPQPHLHVEAGRQKSGKTTLALLLAKSWAEGRPPWQGAPDLAGSRALIISREQPVRRIESLLRRLDHHVEPADEDAWPDRILVIARDPELPAEAQPLLCLDGRGLSALRELLENARDEGDPIGFVVLDSLSRLKPSSIEEVDNDAMSAWLDRLEQIALDFGVYMLLIHHQGHDTRGARGQARSAARGASSIGAVASVSMLLERVKGQPRRRRLKVDGSFVLERELLFDIADAGEPAGAIHYFRLADPYAVYDPPALIGSEGISKNELAWRVSGKPREK